MGASEPLAPADRAGRQFRVPTTDLLPPEWTGVPPPLSLFGLEFSLNTASLDALEEVVRSVTAERVAGWFAREVGLEAVAVLTTCHRVEFGLLASSEEALDRWRQLLPGERDRWRVRTGREAVRHLYRVAAGLESLAVGEVEVRQQVRSAATSVLSRHPRPVLRDLYAGAARSAEEAGPTAGPARSIASIAAARLMALVGTEEPRVLVIGSGTVGQQLVQSLAPRAHVTIAYHQRPPEEGFLRAMGARAVPLDQLSAEVAASDAIVTAAKFGNHGLRAADLPQGRPLLLIDLGVPRNIDPGVRALPNVRLVDLEELHALPGSRDDASVLTRRVDRLADRYADRVERLLLEPWVDAIRRTAEEVRRVELARARDYLGVLDPEQELAIDQLTRRLVARLLLAPTERLRALPPGPEGDLGRRVAVELLHPLPPDL